MGRGARWLLSAVLGASVCLACSDKASRRTPIGPLPTPEQVSGSTCTAGMAGDFPCLNTDLGAYLDFGVFANDIWGWTDPMTGHEYAIIGLSAWTAFVDVTDPSDPVVVGYVKSQTDASYWQDIKVYADHAFIVSEADNHGMQVVDLTLLRSATPVEELPLAAHYDRFGYAHNIAIDEDTGYAYAVGTRTCAGGLHMIDISNPTNPTFAGCFSADGYTHDAQCVVYHGGDAAYLGREICFNSNEDTLTIVDVTDKSAPLLISRTSYAGVGYTHQGWLTEDHEFFLLDDELDESRLGGNTRTYLWDLTSLDAPVVVAVHAGTTTATDHNQYVVDDHVYQANYQGGVRILRLGDLDLAQLAEVAFFDTRPEGDSTRLVGAWSVYPFFSSDTIVASDTLGRLFVLLPDLGAVPECSDGLDNDLDGDVDFGADAGCVAADDPSELP